LPNTNGAGPLVPTEAQRAAAYQRYVTAALSKPAIVGLHWFEHADQPAEGRFDGENSNFGIVTINDDVYEKLTQVMKSVNAEAEALHAAVGRIS
jgi:agarase